MRYTSINEIFAKFITDTGDNIINVSDMVTWAAEALKKIGAFPQFVTRITGVRDVYGYNDTLTVSNFETEVPCDCYRPLSVAISTNKTQGFTACRRSTGFFDVRQMENTLSNKQTSSIDPFPSPLYDKIDFVRDIFNESWADAWTRLNSDVHLNTVLDLAFDTDGSVSMRGTMMEYVYDYQHPYLRFPLKNGYCILAYQAIPTDCDGYPLIPDDEDIKEALFWYINMKMLYRDYYSHKEGAKDLYKDAQYEWKSKKMACYGNLMMPNGVDDLRAIEGIWLRMIPKLNEHNTGYRNIGTGEKLFNRM